MPQPNPSGHALSPKRGFTALTARPVASQGHSGQSGTRTSLTPLRDAGRLVWGLDDLLAVFLRVQLMTIYVKKLIYSNYIPTFLDGENGF